MEVTDDLLAYLDGDRFSSGLAVQIASRTEPVRDRNDQLVELVAGRTVVHVGCVDHLALLDAKISTGLWLHARLSDAAERCIGVDINVEGVDRLRSHYGRRDVFCVDILRDDLAELAEHHWDYLLLADVLEHLDDPIAFLRTLAARHARRFREVVITVPNAFAISNRRSAARGREVVNTDHRYWFTPYTILKVIRRAGLEPRWLTYAGFTPTTTWGRLRRAVARRSYAAHGETLVVGMTMRRD